MLCAFWGSGSEVKVLALGSERHWICFWKLSCEREDPLAKELFQIDVEANLGSHFFARAIGVIEVGSS